MLVLFRTVLIVRNITHQHIWTFSSKENNEPYPGSLVSKQSTRTLELRLFPLCLWSVNRTLPYEDRFRKRFWNSRQNKNQKSYPCGRTILNSPCYIHPCSLRFWGLSGTKKGMKTYKRIVSPSSRPSIARTDFTTFTLWRVKREIHISSKLRDLGTQLGSTGGMIS